MCLKHGNDPIEYYDELWSNWFLPLDDNGDRVAPGCISLAVVLLNMSWDNKHPFYLIEADQYSRGLYDFDRSHQDYDFLSFDELNEILETIDYSSHEDIMAMIFAIGISFQAEYTAEETFAFLDPKVFTQKLGYDDAMYISGENPDFFKFLNKNMDLNWPVVLKIKSEYWENSHVTLVTKHDEETDLYYLPEFEGYYSLDELPLGFYVVGGIFNLHLN